MKNAIKIFALLLLMAGGIMECTKEGPQIRGHIGSPTLGGFMFTEGNWRISSCKESSTDETALYTGLTFEFRADKTILVPEQDSLIGKWDFTTNEMQITFPPFSKLAKLNGTYHYTGVNDHTFDLDITSGGMVSRFIEFRKMLKI
jgi:hypothetical protein